MKTKAPVLIESRGRILDRFKLMELAHSLPYNRDKNFTGYHVQVTDCNMREMIETVKDLKDTYKDHLHIVLYNSMTVLNPPLFTPESATAFITISRKTK